ncbi:hypothetical protein CN918_30610 [Priestia megaterium]|nr:hypothetical protein CN918_30610 [Priestia megaterium]
MVIQTISKKPLSLTYPHPAHTLRFRQMPKKGHVVFDLSTAFLSAMEQTQSTHIEFGLNVERTHLYLRLNCISNGLSLKTKTNQYRLKTIGATIAWRSLYEKAPSSRFTHTYVGRKLNECIYEFPLYDAKTIISSPTPNIENVQWFEETEYQRILMPYVKFTTNYRNYAMFYMSAPFISLAKESRSTHLEFGYHKKSNQLFFRLNKDGKGLQLTAKNGQYKNTSVRADGLFLNLQKQFAHIEIDKEYSLLPVGENVYSTPLSPSKNLKTNVTRSIMWCKESDYVYERTFPLTLHFMGRKDISSARNLYLSKSLIDCAQSNGYTHIQFGYEANKQIGFIRLNQEGKGLSLKMESGTYRYAPSGATTLYKSLVRYLPYMQEDKVYTCKEIGSGVYSYFVEDSLVDNIQESAEDTNVYWLTPDEHIQSQRVQESDSAYSVKFYQTYKKVKGPSHLGSYAIYLSQAFYAYIKNHRKSYIRFQVDSNQQLLYLHLNQEAGLCLIDPRTKDYFTAHIGISHIMRSLQVALPALRERKKYHLHHLDASTFVLNVGKSTMPITEIKPTPNKRVVVTKSIEKKVANKDIVSKPAPLTTEETVTSVKGESVKFFFESETIHNPALYRLRMSSKLLRKWQKGKWTHAHVEWNYDEGYMQIQLNQKGLGISLIDPSTYTWRKDSIAIPLSLWPDTHQLNPVVRKGILVEKEDGCYLLHISAFLED